MTTSWLPGPTDDEPPRGLAEPGDVLHAQLELARARLLRKLDGLTPAQLSGSVLPSGWTPLELVVHLTAVERRWLQWGFQAQPLTDPWRDQDDDGRWRVPDGMTPQQVLAAYAEQCAVSREVAAGVPLTRRSALGGRFTAPEQAPTLAWVLAHLLQEHSRHLGHLDVVRELLDGVVGE